MSGLNKIIYFDRETINNILQQSNRGEKTIKTDATSTTKGAAELAAESAIKLSVPFTKKLFFLFSGKLNASYVKQLDKTVTITSTDISEFEVLKSKLRSFENIQIKDIENSSTFLG